MIKNRTNLIQLEEYRRAKALQKYTLMRPKPIKRLTEEQMRSIEEKRREDD